MNTQSIFLCPRVMDHRRTPPEFDSVVCMCANAGVHAAVHTWRPEVSAGCFFQSLSTLFFLETGFLQGTWSSPFPFRFFYIYLFLFYVLACFACLSVCEPCTCSTHSGQKRASDPLELELQELESHPVGAGNENFRLAKASALLC